MKNKAFHFCWLIVVALLLFSACAPIPPTPNTTLDVNAIYTQAAQTLTFQLTLSAGETAVAQLTQIAANPSPEMPTSTIESAATNTPIQPSSTPVPTSTPFPPTHTPSLTPTNSIPCDWVEFIGDVAVGDGESVQPETAFTKIWRLKNIGACTWTPEYTLVFVNGDQMAGPLFTSLGQYVSPGQTMDLSVDLVAPSDPGNYMGLWQLRNQEGTPFGTGDNQDQPFWVSIVVTKLARLVWDLTQNYCRATWSTNALNVLACPDPSENTDTGFINLNTNPVLEDVSTENEPALVAFPGQGKQGFIQGIFPAYRVKNGDRFRVVTGCLYESMDCYITYQLNYRVVGGKVKTLEVWKEKYDGKIHTIDVDLSQLAGRDIELILKVLNNGNSSDDLAVWLLPSIWR